LYLKTRAYGSTSKSNVIRQHGPLAHGQFKSTLYTTLNIVDKLKEEIRPKQDDGIETIEIRMPNITVKGGDSVLYTFYEFPSDKKYHVIKVEGLPDNKYVN
jgi:hypothetical protein